MNYIDNFKILAKHLYEMQDLDDDGNQRPNANFKVNCSIGEESVIIDYGTKRGGNTIVITGFKEAPMPLAKCGALITHYGDKYLNHVGCGPAKVHIVTDLDSYKNAWSYICACVEFPNVLDFYACNDCGNLKFKDREQFDQFTSACRC